MHIAQNMCSLLFKWEENKFLYVMDILDCVTPKSKVRLLYMMKIQWLELGDSCSVLIKEKTDIPSLYRYQNLGIADMIC
jgi:hypothetical protein